jgi:predicted small lipoprotein YifL
MIKSLIIISIFFTLLTSCGKKGDPQYEGNEMTFPKSID